MTVRTPDAPEPDETPAPLASAPLDKLIAGWRAPLAEDAVMGREEYFSGAVVGDILDYGRSRGLDVRQLIGELGRRLTEAAQALGKPPFGESDIERFAEELDASEESIPRPAE